MVRRGQNRYTELLFELIQVQALKFVGFHEFPDMVHIAGSRQLTQVKFQTFDVTVCHGQQNTVNQNDDIEPCLILAVEIYQASRVFTNEASDQELENKKLSLKL